MFSSLVARTLSALLVPCALHAADPARPMSYSPVREAVAAFNASDWTKAADLYRQVVADNPLVGRRWDEYAHALHHLGRHAEAADAWQRAVELGYRPAGQMYNVACAYSKMGKPDEALAWLEKALLAGFSNEEALKNDSDLESLHSLDRFKSLVGVPPIGLSRDDGWRFDLDFLARRMEQVHFDLFAKVSRSEFTEGIERLKADLPRLSDGEIAVAIQHILAMVGDGHTVLQAMHNPPFSDDLYPVAFTLFTDGLFITGAADSAKPLLGGKVLRIGGKTPQEAIDRITPMISRDNSIWIKIVAPGLLRNPVILHALRISDSPGSVSITIQDRSGKELTAALAPEHGQLSHSLPQAHTLSAAPTPLYLQKRDQNFWFEHLPEKKMVWCQYNVVQNTPDESIEQFAARMFKFIDENPVEYLVIDMRHNHGGNSYLNRPLVHGLIRSDKINRRGRLFVVIGRTTFSAAMNGVIDIERNTRALFVGEPTGSSPNFVGESTPITLPVSGLKLTCSSLYWQSSVATDQRTWLAPELLAELSSADYYANRDPALAVIERYIAEAPE